MKAKEYIKGLLFSKRDVENWIAGKNFPIGKYDKDLGYVHVDRRSRDGLGDTVSTYRHDIKSGARIILNNSDVPCRISAYGDSYAHCEQVSDGETWEEILAARIGEPVRNFGIGGHSVCQMYQRMKQKEPNFRSKLIIMNIFDDDHYRSMIPIQGMRSEIGKFHFHPPIPYVRANPIAQEFKEFDNPAPKPEDLYNFCDIEWTYERFKDDFAVRIMLAKRNATIGEPQDSYGDIEQLAEEHGYPTKIRSATTLLRTVNAIFAAAATYASIRMVQGTAEFASRQGSKVLFVTSYSTSAVACRLKGGGAFDVPEKRRPGFRYNSEFVDFMKKSGLPWVDLAQAHVIDYSTSNLGIPEYLARYWVYPQHFASHYAPLGNWFTADTIRDKVVELLNPKPPAYRPAGLEWDGSVALPD